MDSYSIITWPRKKAVENAYHVEIREDDIAFLKKVSSSKKQLYPDIAHHLIKKKVNNDIKEEKKEDKKKTKLKKY